MSLTIREFKDKIIGKIKKKFEVKEEKSHHIFYKIYYNGRRVGKTYCSHGSGGKEISKRVLSEIRGQLNLDTLKQLYDLKNCPMTAEDYFILLKEKGEIKE